MTKAYFVMLVSLSFVIKRNDAIIEIQTAMLLSQLDCVSAVWEERISCYQCKREARICLVHFLSILQKGLFMTEHILIMGVAPGKGLPSEVEWGMLSCVKTMHRSPFVHDSETGLRWPGERLAYSLLTLNHFTLSVHKVLPHLHSRRWALLLLFSFSQSVKALQLVMPCSSPRSRSTFSILQMYLRACILSEAQHFLLSRLDRWRKLFSWMSAKH